MRRGERAEEKGEGGDRGAICNKSEIGICSSWNVVTAIEPFIIIKWSPENIQVKKKPLTANKTEEASFQLWQAIAPGNLFIYHRDCDCLKLLYYMYNGNLLIFKFYG